MSRSRRALALAVLAVFVVSSLAIDPTNPPPARAVTVTVEYDPTAPDAVDPCAPNPPLTVCVGFNQTARALALVQAAADHWRDIIADDHAMTIRFSWLDPAEGTLPFASIIDTDDQGRVTAGRVYFNPTVAYFYDQTPDLDEEFLGRRTNSNSRLLSGMMRPKLYRTLHPDEKAEAFLNTASEIVEVGHNGLQEGPPGVDFYTIALHEVGHLFGLVPPWQRCNENAVTAGYVPALNLTGGVPLAIKALENADGSFDCNHLAAGGITACKPPPGDQDTTSPDPSTQAGLSIHDCTAHQALFWSGPYPGGRQRPSVVDILALATAKGWQQIDLPRKYSLGSGGAWTAGGTWFGNRAPDGGDDVYVVNQQHSGGPFTTVTSNSNRSARNLFISDENRVRVTGGTLSIGRTVWLAGADSREGPVRPILPPPPGPPPVGQEPVPATLLVEGGGLVTGDRLGVEPGARLRLEGSGRAQFGDVINSGSIQGRGLLGVARSLINGTTAAENGTGQPASGIIRADGGLLRIVTPPGGGVTTDPPIVDLDGGSPLTAATPARVWAIDGDVEIDAVVDNIAGFNLDGFCLDIRVGAGRTLRFARNGITLNNCNGNDATYGLRFEGGAAGATLDAPPSTVFGNVFADGAARLTGRLRLGAGASVRLALGGTTPGSQYDRLQVEDVAELGGTLQVSLKDGFTPQAGQSFTVMTYESRVGQFATVDLPPLPFGLLWDVQYGATSLRLVVMANLAPNPPNSGVDTDVDDDGDSDVFDLLAILQHFGPCPPAPAACPWDLDEDGDVDNDDVLLWLEST
jgi:hypothetical protein